MSCARRTSECSYVGLGPTSVPTFLCAFHSEFRKRRCVVQFCAARVALFLCHMDGMCELDELELNELWTMVAAGTRCDLGPIGNVSS